jgi:hypothetical protein
MGLIDDHEGRLLCIGLSPKICLVAHSSFVVDACILAEFCELFVLSLVLPHQSPIVEDYVDVMVCVLEEQEGQSCMNCRLALASRHDPDLCCFPLRVEVGQCGSRLLKVIDGCISLIEDFDKLKSFKLDKFLFALEISVPVCNGQEGSNCVVLVFDDLDLGIIRSLLSPHVKGDAIVLPGSSFGHFAQVACDLDHFAKLRHGELLLLIVCFVDSSLDHGDLVLREVLQQGPSSTFEEVQL